MPSDARASFSTSEIIRVLEIFGIGGLKSLADLPAGSRRAAKLVAQCESGSFLLKRREVQGNAIERVRCAGHVHQRVMQSEVPCARLLTTVEGEPFLIESGFIYEAQEFVQGARYTHRHEQAMAAGATLARLHLALESLAQEDATPAPCYCRNPAVTAALERLAARASTPGAAAACTALRDRYNRAAQHPIPERASMTHSDFHPGNVLFDANRVVAVIDFDSARHAPIVTDLANAALQFGLPRVQGSDPAAWEPRFDEHCMRALVRGYRSTSMPPAGTSASIAPLMIQAAIAEVAAPVARRGAFGPIDGWAMLEYLDRKTRWIEESAPGIATLCKA